MAIRSYIIHGGGNENTIPVRVGGVTRYLTFRKNGWDDSPAEYDTEDLSVAMAIEGSIFFAKGLVDVTGDTVPLRREEDGSFAPLSSPSSPKGEQAEVREYPDVSSVQEAKEVLNKEYDVPYSRLGNKEQVMRVSEECGVRFPGL